jgi:large subunit ribosomal protein L4
MPTVTVHDRTGKDTGSLELPEETFGITPNVAVMHQVVTAQLAARRAGTQSTKTRAEVAGGGAKPFRQKGTGNARQGSITAPHYRGGGVALGPKPRSYAQRTPKKMKALALRSALSDRASEGKVVVIDDWGFEQPRTKDAVALLAALGVEGRSLVVVRADDEVTWKAFRNLPEVHVITPGELNTYDVLVSDYLLFTPDTLPGSGSPGARRDGEDETAAVGQGPHVAEEAGVSGGPGARRASDETAAVGQEQVDDEEAEA